MYKVVVIIPAYNAERTIERSVSSVMTALGRVAGACELVVVDDGSKDETARILQGLSYDIKNVKLRVVCQPNSGCYQARLTGMRSMEAEYFAFADADDAVDPDIYTRMLAFAEQNSLDVAECDIFGCVGNGGVDELSLTKDAVVDDFVKPVLGFGVRSAFAWNKLYRNRDIILEPSPIFMYEDLALNLQLFDGVERFGRLHQGLYHYEVNPGSSVRNFRRKNVDDLSEILRFRKKYLPRYGIDERDALHGKWLSKNVRNMFLTAASAKCESWKLRQSNISYLFERVGMSPPGRVLIIFTMVAKRMQIVLKRILGKDRWK